MPGALFVEGETVALRTLEDDDIDFLQRTINDPRVRHRVAAVEPKSQEDEKEWLESMGEEGDAHFLVTVDGERVGVVSLNPPNETWGRVEIAYMIDPPHWNNGYGTEAVTLACRYAFEERRLHKVYASAYATNEGSQRVLEKVGFEREGVFREEAFVQGEYVDLYRYGLLAEEFSG